MKKLFFLACLFVGCACFTACGGEDDPATGGTTTEDSSVSLDPSSVNATAKFTSTYNVYLKLECDETDTDVYEFTVKTGNGVSGNPNSWAYSNTVEPYVTENGKTLIVDLRTDTEKTVKNIFITVNYGNGCSAQVSVEL